LKVEAVVFGVIEAGEHEAVFRLAGDGAAEGIDDAFAAHRVPVLEPVPMDAVGAVGDVKKLSIANERTELGFVEREGLAGGLVLLGRPA